MSIATRRRSVLLVLLAAAPAAWITAASWSVSPPSGLWFWTVVCFAGELMWIRLPVGQATLSMASCCHFAALLLLPRGQAMAAAAISGALAEAFFIRKPALRVLFNASQTALAVGAASWAFTATGASSRDLMALITHAHLLPFALAGAAYFVVNTGAVSLAIALSEGIRPVSAWRENFGHGYELLSSSALLSLGVLLASYFATAGPGGTLLVALPVMLAFDGYRRVAARRLGGRPLEETARAGS